MPKVMPPRHCDRAGLGVGECGRPGKDSQHAADARLACDRIDRDLGEVTAIGRLADLVFGIAGLGVALRRRSSPPSRISASVILRLPMIAWPSFRVRSSAVQSSFSQIWRRMSSQAMEHSPGAVRRRTEGSGPTRTRVVEARVAEASLSTWAIRQARAISAASASGWHKVPGADVGHVRLDDRSPVGGEPDAQAFDSISIC